MKQNFCVPTFQIAPHQSNHSEYSLNWENKNLVANEKCCLICHLNYAPLFWSISWLCFYSSGSRNGGLAGGMGWQLWLLLLLEHSDQWGVLGAASLSSWSGAKPDSVCKQVGVTDTHSPQYYLSFVRSKWSEVHKFSLFIVLKFRL